MIHNTSASPACGYKMMLHFLFMSRLLVSELTPGRQPPQSFLGVSQHLVSHVLQSKSVSFLIYICSYARTVPTIALLFWAANFFFFFFLVTPLGMLDLSSLTRIKPMSPALEAWNPNHWTSKEFPGQLFLTLGPHCHPLGFIMSLLLNPTSRITIGK